MCLAKGEITWNLVKLITKKSGKYERERKVLLSLIEHYLKTGKPVGSNTLKETGFADLSSATIRNYFAHLEEEGYLMQQHTSGGRIPTDKAYRLYAQEYCQTTEHVADKNLSFEQLRSSETREIIAFLHQAAEQLAEETKMAVFLSAPRFEQDFIIGIKLMPIDSERCLCALVTDFGEIITEVLHTGQKLSAFAAKRMETYFNWRLTNQNKPENLNKEEEELALKLYNELMVRYIVSYSHFDHEEIYRTGFSSLLTYPEFHDPTLLTNSLALFENTHGMRLLLKECCKFKTLKFWIGEDLNPYSPQAKTDCAVIAAPYHINRQPVGAIGLLGPARMPYRQLFLILRQFAESISEALTNSLYKFKISMRQPKQKTIDLKQQEPILIGQAGRLLLEDKSHAQIKKTPDLNNQASRRK